MGKDWYDNAEAYDIVFDVDTKPDADGLERLADQFLERPLRTVLEPACGSGRLVRELSNRGFEVTGFDRNAAMVRYCKSRQAKEARNARVVEADLRDFDLGSEFDLAHCLISSFKHLSRERDAQAHLRAVAAALRPGGVYVLAFHLTDYIDSADDQESWSASRDGVSVHLTLDSRRADPQRRREHMSLQMEIEGMGPKDRIEATWWFRTYDAAQVRRLLHAVPELSLEAVYDFDFEPGELDDERLDTVLVLRRR